MSSGRVVVAVLSCLVLAAVATGCSGEIIASQCAPAVGGNEPPAAPAILGPAAGVVAPDALSITLSGFDDPESDAHAATEVEIWRVVFDEPVELVWSARVTAPDDLLKITLDAGQFRNAAVALDDRTDHLIKARFFDDSGTCSAAGAFAEARFRTDDVSAYLFDPALIHEIRLDISPESLAAINAEARPPGCVPFERDSHPGTLRFEDQVFEGVGLRSKGGCGSARTVDRKTAFKVNLSWDDPDVAGCPEDRRLFGLKRLTLNNMVQDRTQLHESLAYRLYAAMGVPVPRTAYVQLVVNDELWGLYLHVESIDRRFLERRFDSKEGMVYEGTYWCDLVPANAPANPTDDSGCFSRKFSPDACDAPPPAGADPLTYEPLIGLINDIAALPQGGFYPEVEALFDFDTFLSLWAVDSIIAHWDGYEFDIMNNYRVYHDPATGKWTVIPTGVDQTFNNGRDVNPFGPSGVLARRCNEEPDCREAFTARLAQAIDTFESLDLAAVAQQLHAQIEPLVLADPRKEVTNSNFQTQVSDLFNWLPARPQAMRNKIGQ